MADLVRARPGRLARHREADDDKVVEFLAFLLAGELYGIELRRIREILSSPPLTIVPRAPHDVLGVCSVRGLLVTVVDLRRRLRLAESAPTRKARILLTQTEAGEVCGLFVDEVKQVMRFPSTGIEVASAVLGGDVSAHVLGIARPAGSPVILLDLASIVAW
jgi:purine-binding chemotaxis protein CheW